VSSPNLETKIGKRGDREREKGWDKPIPPSLTGRTRIQAQAFWEKSGKKENEISLKSKGRELALREKQARAIR